MSYTLRISLFVLLQILLFTNVNAQNVARIGETYYSAFIDALSSAVSGDEIVLLEDVDLTSELSISKKRIDLNLNNHSITNNTTYSIIITSDAELSIIGNGKIKSNVENDELVSNYGVLNIYSAVIESPKSKRGSVNNNGTLNFYGGQILNILEYTNRITNVSTPDGTVALYLGKDAITNIKGGLISSNKLAINILSNTNSLRIDQKANIIGFVYAKDATNITIPDGMIIYSGNGTFGKNVVINNLGKTNDKTCESLELTDNYGYNVPFPIKTNTAKYTRYMSKGWGTLCLPFAIDIVNSDVECYQITAISGEELVLNRYNENVPAGTPVIIKKKDDSKNEIVVVGSGLTCITPSTDTNMKGAFEQTYIQSKTNENYYFISNNKFWNAEVSTLVYPYRAYFTYPSFNPLSPKWKPAQSFDITISDEELTSVNSQEYTDFDINSIYDIDGKILNGLQQGINIVKLSNGQTKKILVR